jgi:hypothetical protein
MALVHRMNWYAWYGTWLRYNNLDERVSYSGYYVTFPRLRSGFDSRYPHQASLLPYVYYIFLLVAQGRTN